MGGLEVCENCRFFGNDEERIGWYGFCANPEGEWLYPPHPEVDYCIEFEFRKENE